MVSYLGYNYNNKKYIIYNENEYKEVTYLERLEDLVITDEESIYTKLKEDKLQVQYISNYLNILGASNVFEIFDMYFKEREPTDYEMLQAIFNGLILDNKKTCYVLKIGVTFAWFEMESRNINILGAGQISNQSTKYAVGSYVKEIQYKVALSGVNIKNIKYIVWNEEDRDNEFNYYIENYDILEKFFQQIEGLSNLPINKIIYLLKHNIQGRIDVTAQSMVEALNDSFKALGLHEENQSIYSKKIYYKDYSSSKSLAIDYNRAVYGIILDCEGIKGSDGSLTHGVSELGGLIYCRYRNVMLNIQSFHCDRILVQETITQVINHFAEISGKARCSINVVTFGTADEKMLRYSIEKQKLINRFKFYDIRADIINYLERNNIQVEGKTTVTNVAKSLGVLPLYPKHNPVNDSRTLFNIMAEMLINGFNPLN